MIWSNDDTMVATLRDDDDDDDDGDADGDDDDDDADAGLMAETAA